MDTKKEVLIQIVTTKGELTDLIRECIAPIVNDQSSEEDKGSEEGEEEDELLTVLEMSLLMKVSTTTIHSWKNKGVIPYLRINSRIRFKKSIIMKLHEKRRRRQI